MDNDNRRKLRMFVLSAVCLGVLFYLWLFFIPQIRAIQALRTDIGAAGDSMKINEIYQKRLLNLDGESAKLAKKIQEVRSSYPPVLKHSDIVQILTSIAEESGLEVENISLMDFQVAPGNGARTDSGQGKAVKPAAPPNAIVNDPQMIDLMQNLGLGGRGETSSRAFGDIMIADGDPYFLPVKFQAQGSQNEVKTFFASLADLPNRVIVKEYLMQPGETGGIYITALIHFYGIADSNAANQRLLDEYIFSGQAGETDLFSNLMVYKDREANGSAEQEAKSADVASEYDFTMRAVPYGNNMAPSTVSLSARGIVDTSKTPVIFGDNKGQEKVELVVQEKNGRFFCKYKTEDEVYPDKKYQQLAEFKPGAKDLKMIIDSTPRKFAADSAGVLLSIDNQTSRRLEVTIMNDDNESPRIKINKQGGVINLDRIKG